MLSGTLSYIRVMLTISHEDTIVKKDLLWILVFPLPEQGQEAVDFCQHLCSFRFWLPFLAYVINVVEVFCWRSNITPRVVPFPVTMGRMSLGKKLRPPAPPSNGVFLFFGTFTPMCSTSDDVIIGFVSVLNVNTIFHHTSINKIRIEELNSKLTQTTMGFSIMLLNSCGSTFSVTDKVLNSHAYMYLKTVHFRAVEIVWLNNYK